MTTFLDTQKALARELLIGKQTDSLDVWDLAVHGSTVAKIDTLIEQVLKNHHTELMRLLKDEIEKHEPVYDSVNLSYVAALSKAITLSEQLIKPATP